MIENNRYNYVFTGFWPYSEEKPNDPIISKGPKIQPIKLPEDVLYLIFVNFSSDEYLKKRLVCKYIFNIISKDDILWKSLVLKYLAWFNLRSFWVTVDMAISACFQIAIFEKN